ncbi:MAG: hypothetical protein CMQ38_09535 [Gammaproteobacteria bacterium]|nr:hypothetical protein [Gammaproteobacteria bacterium]|tara:strand:+ start:481 stop:687 length:207 start_codon:yes stop_codon:yes gene_type:complete
MLIKISSPVFKCADDENIFFSRLAALPGYSHVIQKGPELQLYLKDELDSKASKTLQEICDTWGATYKQ